MTAKDAERAKGKAERGPRGQDAERASGAATPRPVRVPRAEKTAATRAAILDAALDEFSSKGFASTRLDDVARRAGVAKGTIYVHFRDKETLFQELVRSFLGPVIAFAEDAPALDIPLRAFADQFVDVFEREIFRTRRKNVLRLVLTEGPRFPQLAHIYYRDVIKRGLSALRVLVRRAIERGEIRSDALERFPQLLVAPGIVAVIWDSLFASFEPLDSKALLRTHVDLLFSALERGTP